MRTSSVFTRAEGEFDAEHQRDVNIVLQVIQRQGELDTRVECAEGHVHGGQLQLCHNQGHSQGIEMHRGSPGEVSQDTKTCPPTASKLLMLSVAQ